MSAVRSRPTPRRPLIDEIFIRGFLLNGAGCTSLPGALKPIVLYISGNKDRLVDYNTYTSSQIAKLGNAIIFLCEQIQPITPVSKTHILKLVFILEEEAIKKTGIPFFGLHYHVWKLGPVSEDLYYELSEELSLLKPYISKKTNADGTTLIAPAKAFEDDEFSDQDLALMREVADRFKFCSASELINYTHKTGSPWYDTAVANGVLQELELQKINTTDIEIDLEKLIEHDPLKKQLYQEYQEFIAQVSSLK